MSISKVHLQIQRLPTLSCLIIMMIVAAGSPAAKAENSTPKVIQAVINDCLVALWTGKSHTPAFKQQQNAFKTLLKSNPMGKADLSNMVKSSLVPIVDKYKTSRYILAALPEQINTLFSPVMNWQEFEKIMWWALVSSVDAADPVRITIGTLGPPGTPWIEVPETMLFPKISKISQGKVRLKIYGGGVMGEDTEILKKMTAGRLDGCGCTALGVLEASPEASAMLLPGLFKNYDEIDYICKTFRKDLDKAFEARGYVLAGLIDTGYFYLFSKNKISGLPALKKQKVLTWFGAIEAALFQELGINSIPVAVPDVVSAFGTDAGDTVLSPAAWMLGMQAYQYANFYCKPPLLYSPTAIFVTRQTVKRIEKQVGISNTLASNIQELIIAEIMAIEPEWNRQIRAYEEKSLKAFETKCGICAFTLSPEDQQRIEKAGKAIQLNLAGKAFSKDFIEKINKALENYRAQH